MQTLAILTNGGDTCALNASILSIRDSAYDAGYKKIYGVRRGYQGLVDGWIDDITLEAIDPKIGGSFLGSLRVSPTDRHVDESGEHHRINERRCLEMAKFLRDRGVNVLVVIGGDGTLQATEKFREWLNANKNHRGVGELQIIGFLKTIDNDIRTYTHFEGIDVSLCPGYPSAVKKIVSCAEELRVTAKTAERAFTIECMGRGAGWLAAAATFGGAEILLVPEHQKIWDRLNRGRAFGGLPEGKGLNDLSASEKQRLMSRDILHRLVGSLADLYSNNRNVLVAVAEGFDPGMDFEGSEQFKRAIRDLYGQRKVVGATELITMIVAPVLAYYFECLSIVCSGLPYGRLDLLEAICEAMKRGVESPVGKDYTEKVKNKPDHPLHDWDVKAKLRSMLDKHESRLDCEQAACGTCDSMPSAHTERKSPMAAAPYRFEIRPHRTDYLPRSGPPSSYDFRLATVLGQKVGEMLIESDFSKVPALNEVVPYDQLTIDKVKTVAIEDVTPRLFNEPDYFRPDRPLQVSRRITNYFRTIISGPESLDEAIHEAPKRRT